MSHYKLIALDLDGTILNRQATISPRVRQTIRQVLQRGIPVTIATGRNFLMTQKFAQQLGIHTPLICAQGAIVQDPVTRHQYRHETVPLADFHTFIECARQRSLQLMAVQEGYIYTSRQSEDLALYKSLSPGDVRLVPDLKTFIKEPVTKVVIVCRTDNQAAVEADLRQQIPPHLKMIRSHDYLLEVVSRKASKGQALRFLCDHLDIVPQDVLAIGDHENDIDLLQVAGFGIAMESGYAHLKSVADWIAPPLTEDGAAVALERFILAADPDPTKTPLQS